MEVTVPKKDWIVTQNAFDKLLGVLDTDREQAGEKYERIRQKLTKIFRWRGCSLPEEYVDRTMDRVARRLDEGAELRVSNPYLYFHGVALNVLREYRREMEKTPASLDDGLRKSPSADPVEFAERGAALVKREGRHECLDRCLGRFPRKDVDLITHYHLETGSNKDRRARLAESMRIPLKTLRIRVYRVRLALEGCIERCLEDSRVA